MEVTDHIDHSSTKTVRGLITTLLENSELGLDNRTDLVTGKYEGGLKLWECSLDLLDFLSSQDSIPNKVLELGCGHGLPGLYCAQRGSLVSLQDYNLEVIQNITINNAVKNQVRHLCRFFYGPWGDYSHLGQHDLVLTSETIYNPDYYPSLLQAINTTGARLVYVACKNYYFGVGGGSELFMNAARADGWNCSIAKRITEIASTRFIIAMTKS
jgi:hypothetical protein